MNINQVWPEWNEECVLGEGSFGKVYRAKRIEYGRTFYSAIKVITVPKSAQEIKYAKSQGMNDSEVYDYFRGLVDNLLNEISLMDNLKGAQNIVGIEDYKIIEHQGDIGWDIFIRMELLSPFDSFVSNPEFSQKDVIKLGLDICTALEVCERNNIVHRDIKPDNIFISRFGEYKLGDFGIARKLEATQANLSRKGTLNYMAPEVYKSESYGSNVDIYSLGLVLYTLLNNNRIAFLPAYPQPISYSDNEEALSKRLSGVPIPPPCNANPSLAAAIVKACAYNPQERYATATEFKNALIAEWNLIAQSGDNRGIAVEPMQYGGTAQRQFVNTTNDMTAHGRLVVDGYSDETSVLDDSMSYYQDNGNYYGQEYGDTYSNGYYSRSKSNKVCRILAFPFFAAVCVLGIILMAISKEFISGLIGVGVLSVGTIGLVCDRNKIAMGICAAALAVPYICLGTHALISGVTGKEIVTYIVFLLSGLLLLFGGISILSQKEVRFGGSLCVYAVAVEWIYNIYNAVNGAFSVELAQIAYGISAFTLLLWSYGYKSDYIPSGVVKALKIVGYVLSGIAALYVLFNAIYYIYYYTF